MSITVRFHGRRTSPFMRGALPSSPTGCTNAARLKYRSTSGLNSSPASGARQSAPVVFGRFVPLKIGSGAAVVTPMGRREKLVKRWAKKGFPLPYSPRMALK